MAAIMNAVTPYPESVIAFLIIAVSEPSGLNSIIAFPDTALAVTDLTPPTFVTLA